jgi:hypothetical protein
VETFDGKALVLREISVLASRVPLSEPRQCVEGRSESYLSQIKVVVIRMNVHLEDVTIATYGFRS